MQDIEFKISQFADDTSIFLDGTSQSLNNTLEELDRFAKISGLKLIMIKHNLFGLAPRNTVQILLKQNGNYYGVVVDSDCWELTLM